jgi:hypothetical protein
LPDRADEILGAVGVGIGDEALAKHFLEATIKHFSYTDYEKALKWLKAPEVGPK